MDIDDFSPSSMSEVESFVTETTRISLMEYLELANQFVHSSNVAIYKTGSIIPVALETGEIFNTLYDKSGEILDFSEALNVARDIYSFDGKIIIRKKDIASNSYYLSEYKDLRMCSDFITSVLVEYLRTRVRLTRSTDGTYRLDRRISDSAVDLLHRKLRPVIDSLNEAIQSGTSFVYSVNNTSTELLLCKKMDYRIYEYYRSMFKD